MNDQEQKQLGKTLWAIADTLRGAMNADDFRDYMLAFLFLRYLSDNYEFAAAKELGSDYPADHAEVVRTLGVNSRLELWYKDNPDDTEVFEKQMRRRMHYVIRPEYLWTSIAELARKQQNELLDTLQAALNYIEIGILPEHLPGAVFRDQSGVGQAGQDICRAQCQACAPSSQKIAEGLTEFSTDSDTLGDAYEYLIGQFAAGSGKKAGEFYTPQQISQTFSRQSSRWTARSQKPAKKAKLDSVMDFACGSGSLLLNVRKRMGPHGIGKIFGQEKNITTYNLARMNMLLHGVKDSEFEIFHGDTLTNDWEMLRETNPAKKPYFDAVVANPPVQLPLGTH